MKDNTYKTLLLTLLVALFLFLLHFLPTFKIGDAKLREIDILSDLAQKKKVLEDVIPSPKKPSAIVAYDKDGKVIDFKEEWPKGTERIVDYSAGKPGGLDHFYSQLNMLAQKQAVGRPVRIAYFGDSYIEGDILLADLREDLQKQYGGYGVGWIDAGNDLDQYKHTVDNKFTGLTEHMVKKPASYDVNQAGIAERYYTMNGQATMSYAPFSLSHDYSRTEKWASTWLYLRSKGGANVTFEIDGGKTSTQRVNPSSAVQAVKMDGVTSHATIKVNGSNTVLFGTSQEGREGIVVDNFSMRGSSGTSLAKLPEQMLKEFALVRPYDLIVFQFGVNAVDAETTPERLKKYMADMKLVVDLFHKCFPETSILIVSSPDRGSKTSPDGTMKGVEMLVGYQEQLAADCHVGFYNLFRAMGGPGTMMRIVDEQSMGTKDYVHINYKGGKYVSQRIFKSIVAGQKNYTRRERLVEE
jgi:hypothetical protein